MLSGSVFLVSFTDPNEQLPNVKSVSKSVDHRSGVYQISKFTAAKEVSLLIFIKQCPLNFISGNG